MTWIHPGWRDDGEYCIRAACGAKGVERVQAGDCASAACRIKRAIRAIVRWNRSDETHFLCRTCRRCRKRRVVLRPDFNWWVARDREIWHESSGVFVRNPDGRFLFFKRTIFPARALTVPSGHVDAEETPHEAAVRELAEEVTGLPDIPADAIVHVATEDISGDSCRRGSDAHRWHAFLVRLDTPIKLENLCVRGEGKNPVLLSLRRARWRRLIFPVRYVIRRHTARLKRLKRSR
jgi:8-oxo-dGTP pyrophosphatase MutT (NUDIX family)